MQRTTNGEAIQVLNQQLRISVHAVDMVSTGKMIPEQLSSFLLAPPIAQRIGMAFDRHWGQRNGERADLKLLNQSIRPNRSCIMELRPTGLHAAFGVEERDSPMRHACHTVAVDQRDRRHCVVLF